MGYPVWDPSPSRGQKLTGTRRESREGPVGDDIRDPCGNRLGVLAGEESYKANSRTVQKIIQRSIKVFKFTNT